MVIKLTIRTFDAFRRVQCKTTTRAAKTNCMTPSLLNHNSHGKKACFSGVCCPILSQGSDLSHLENNLIKSFDYREDAGVRRYHSFVLRFC